MGEVQKLDDLIAEAAERKDDSDKEYQALVKVGKELTRLQQRVQKQGIVHLERIKAAALGVLKENQEHGQASTAMDELAVALGMGPKPSEEKWEKVTSFESLKVGDVIRHWFDWGVVVEGEITEHKRWPDSHLLKVRSGDWRKNLVYKASIDAGRVFRKVTATKPTEPRKPYVSSDGLQWIAEVGDKFRATSLMADRAGQTVTVKTLIGEFDYAYYNCVHSDGTEIPWSLDATCWEPVS